MNLAELLATHGAQILEEWKTQVSGSLHPEAMPHPQLFAPFAQLGSDRSGFGLGLAIAKQAADAHQGVIRVQDLPGKGCIFALELPVSAPG